MRLRERYNQEIAPTLTEEFGYASPMAVPSLSKVVLNIGLGEALTNAKSLDSASQDLAKITGQRPVVTRARKSVANFKLREGNPIGVKVTLRGERMFAFLDRLVNVALPRTRDFRGVSANAFDGRGNYTLGIREQLIFPEIDYDSIDQVRGFEVTIVTTAETDEEARVVDFGSVWPPVDQGAGARARFDQRAFKGEEKLTSAILRVTHKEQTAVVFVRYGGMPLFLGGFMPGQPPAPYGTMKQQLEDANFIVHEWDLKSSEMPPAIDPAPTRTIFVVFKPTPPERGPMGQMSQEPPFSDAQRQALLSAMGDKGRALFIAGWAPGPFGPIPGTYEYGEYLKNNWGITVDTSALLIDFVSTAPGQYNVVRRDFFFMDGLEVTDHDIVTGAQARRLSLPWCAPLELASPAPEGVTLAPLVIQPKRDGLWGVKNIQRYEDQQRERGYLTREPEDLEGPYTLAVAATRGDAKIVVVSARDFAEDQVAFAREVAMGPQGFVIRSRNPGNVTLLINSLHWLNDNTQFMNIGKPIDSAVLQIESSSTEKVVQMFTIFVWPALALCCGGAVWWVRRK